MRRVLVAIWTSFAVVAPVAAQTTASNAAPESAAKEVPPPHAYRGAAALERELIAIQHVIPEHASITFVDGNWMVVEDGKPPRAPNAAEAPEFLRLDRAARSAWLEQKVARNATPLTTAERVELDAAYANMKSALPARSRIFGETRPYTIGLIDGTMRRATPAESAAIDAYNAIDAKFGARPRMAASAPN